MDSRNKIIDFLISRGAWYILVVCAVSGAYFLFTGAAGLYMTFHKGMWNLLLESIAYVSLALALLSVTAAMACRQFKGLTTARG